MASKKESVKAQYLRAQEYLVSALLYDSSSLADVLSLISVEDFSEPVLSAIMQAMVEVSRLDETVSVESVAGQLRLNGTYTVVGDTKLFELFAKGEQSLTLASPMMYAKVVRELSSKHRISVLLSDMQECFDPDSGVDAINGISQVQAKLNDERLKLSDDNAVVDVAQNVSTYNELIEQRYQTSESNKDKAEGLQGIPTLIPSLNKYTSGFMPGQLITVGARSGVGKSVFAVMQAVAAARAGLSVLMISLEMSAQEIVDRIVANMSGVSLGKLKTGYLNADDKERVKKANDELSKMHIQLDTDVRATVDSIRSRCIKEAQSEKGLDILIIDYLQLITPTGRFNSRQEQVADLSRNMKLLAKGLNIPVVVLSQLNRQKNNEDGETPIPTIDNIRESAALGQDSDIVILLHRDNKVDNVTPHTIIILEKNRNGVSHKHITCHSNLECSMFREVKREKDVVDSGLSDADIDDMDIDDFTEFDEEL